MWLGHRRTHVETDDHHLPLSDACRNCVHTLLRRERNVIYRFSFTPNLSFCPLCCATGASHLLAAPYAINTIDRFCTRRQEWTGPTIQCVCVCGDGEQNWENAKRRETKENDNYGIYFYLIASKMGFTCSNTKQMLVFRIWCVRVAYARHS